jgi:hypothetical protein
VKVSLLLKWFNSKKWFEKLFLLLLILRPIVEPYFYIKESSPLFSPLYWIGILTFLISIYGILTNRQIKSKSDRMFMWWSVLVVTNIFCLLFSTDFLNFFIFGLKLIYPVTIYFFFRGFMKSKYDLYGVMMVLLISSGIAGLWLIADILKIGFNLRLGSSFADVINYGVYANLALIISCYFLLKFQLIKKVLWRPNTFILVGIFIISLLTFYAIKHIASLAVFVAILCTYVFFLSQKKIGLFLVVIGIIIVTFLLVGDRFYEDVVNERIEKEVQIVKGQRNQSQALHGRMSRWQWLYKEYKKSNIVGQLFGYPLNLKYSNHMIGITPHNDFLRVLFFTGLFGLIFYLSFLVRIIRKISLLATSEKFLAYASVFCFLLYSISTVPTFYPGFNNFIFAIFAFLSISHKETMEVE